MTTPSSSRSSRNGDTRATQADLRGDPGDWQWDDGRYVRIRPEPPRSRQVLYTLVATVALIAMIGAGAIFWLQRQINPSGGLGDAVVITVPSGSSTDSIATLLAKEGVVNNPTVFRYYLRWKNKGAFQAGLYNMNKNMSFGQAIGVLEAGPAPIETKRFTVPEGLTVAEIAERLDDQIESFDAAEMSSALIRMETPWRPKGSNDWEGLLFPDTYDYALGDTPVEILERMNQQFTKVATDVGLVPYMNLDPVTGAPQGLTAYEYITIASMIEKESRLSDEYGKVSRVIHNRLAIGMPLGIDATVLFARGPERSGPLTDADLAIDSPYNTRLNAGIPPGPIAAPGRAALAAALNPEDGPWLYYVLASNDGSHFFTDDYDEFLAQKEKSQAEGIF